jgi:peptidoglycan/LPS O-acetylase OafA/YrhL
MDRPTLDFIDALRGYAVTLVIASHAFPLVHELPWTVKRFSNLGFFGVQLFFVVSCITLARSWRQRGLVARPALRDFALRRVFRIAPAYFLAALGYRWLIPDGAIDATRVATFLTFTGGWSPGQMPTMPGAWVGTPGGWSIEAEFAFYALFPALIMALRGPGTALAAIAASLALAWIANAAGWANYAPIYGEIATDQFLYYWFPNQLPVFLCGLFVYECLARLLPGGRWQVLGGLLARRSGMLLGISVLVFASLALLPWPRLPAPGSGFLASHVIAAIAFGGTATALALRSMPLLVNRAVVRLGQASFSAYLLHFAVIEAVLRLLPAAVFTPTGLGAAATSGVLFLLVLGVTGLVAQVTYRLIELPAIQLGTRVIGMDRTGAAPRAA